MTATLRGRCHCGEVRLLIRGIDQVAEVRRCDCSICTKRGAWMTGVPLAALEVRAGEPSLRLYVWNTGIAEHWFCSRCGVYTHHRRRSNPQEYAVNVSCLDLPDPRATARFVQLHGGANSLVPEERDRLRFRGT